MKNLFESKQFSIVLGGLLLVLLGVSGVIILGDADESNKKISQTIQTIEEDFTENSPFKKEEPEINPNYEEEISKQYEEYQKVKEEINGDKPKRTNSSSNNHTSVGSTIGDKNNNSKPSYNNGGHSNGGNKGTNKQENKNNSGSKGGNSSKDKNGAVVQLPPINIGNPNPTVPKLPSNPKPPVKPNPQPNDPTDPNDPSDPNEPGDSENPPDDEEPIDPTNPDDEEPTDPVDNPPVIGGNGDFGSITPANRPEPVDTEPHSLPTEEQLNGKSGLSMIATNYGSDYRIVPINYVTNSMGATAEFEFYNPTDKPITLTDQNIKFVYDRGYGDYADSTLANSPVVIQPKSTEKLKVTTSYPEATSVYFIYNGTNSVFNFHANKPTIKDVTPLSNTQINLIDDRYVETISVNDVQGSKNFKLEPLGIVISSNNSIGPLKKEKNGALGLVKVRIANTSNSPIKVERIIAASVDFSSGDLNTVDFPLSDLNLLGGNALPTTIPAKQIVEGYLPFYLKDGNHVAMVYVETDKEDFQITSIESYGVIYNP